MTALVEMGLTNALLATILAVLVAIVARIVRRPALVHALWVIVLLKLVTPPMLDVPVGFEVTLGTAADEQKAPFEPAVAPAAGEPARGDASPSARADGDARPTAVEPAVVGGPPARAVSGERPRGPVSVVVSPGSPVNSTVDAVPGVRSPRSADHEPVGAAARHVPGEGSSSSTAARWSLPAVAPITPLRAIVAIWLAGALIVAAVQFLAVCRCSGWLDRGGRATEGLQREAEAVAAELGIERCPRIWIVVNPLPPMLYALGPFARVVLPSPLLREVDGGTRRLLLAHELAHYRRGDHWVRLLELLAVVLFWWHPVVWWARREIHESEEACCDALVVERVSRGPRVYAEALLDTIDFLSRSAAAAPLASGLGSTESIRRRLTAIMQRNVAVAVGPGAWWGVVGFAALVLPLAPVGFDVPSAEAEAAAVSSVGSPGTGIPIPSSFEDDVNPADRTARLNRPSFADLLQRPPLSPEPAVWAVASSPDGTVTITAATRRGVHHRNAVTRTDVDLSSQGITGVAFPAGSPTFVTSHWDGRLRLWDAATATPLATVAAHRDVARSVAVSPDGRVVISGSADGTLRSWRITGGDDGWSLVAIGSAIDVGRPVNCVRFDAIGGSLLVGLGDWRAPDSGRVLVLPADVDDAAPGTNVVGDAPSIDFDTAVGAIWFDSVTDRTLVGEWNGTVTAIDPRTSDRLDVGRASKDAIAATSFSTASPVPTFEPLPAVPDPAVARAVVPFDRFEPIDSAPVEFRGLRSPID